MHRANASDQRSKFCAQVCSRNLGIAREDEATKGQTAFWAVAELYDLRERLARNPDWILQGEVHGPGLQKNKCRAKTLQLALFNEWSIQERRFLDYEASDQAICPEFTVKVKYSGIYDDGHGPLL